jgi:hypothetical protein
MLPNYRWFTYLKQKKLVAMAMLDYVDVDFQIVSGL